MSKRPIRTTTLHLERFGSVLLLLSFCLAFSPIFVVYIPAGIVYGANPRQGLSGCSPCKGVHSFMNLSVVHVCQKTLKLRYPLPVPVPSGTVHGADPRPGLSGRSPCKGVHSFTSQSLALACACPKTLKPRNSVTPNHPHGRNLVYPSNGSPLAHSHQENYLNLCFIRFSHSQKAYLSQPAGAARRKPPR